MPSFTADVLWGYYFRHKMTEHSHVCMNLILTKHVVWKETVPESINLQLENYGKSNQWQCLHLIAFEYNFYVAKNRFH